MVRDAGSARPSHEPRPLRHRSHVISTAIASISPSFWTCSLMARQAPGVLDMALFPLLVLPIAVGELRNCLSEGDFLELSIVVHDVRKFKLVNCVTACLGKWSIGLTRFSPVLGVGQFRDAELADVTLFSPQPRVTLIAAVTTADRYPGPCSWTRVIRAHKLVKVHHWCAN